jgi:hypothetical protein
MEYKLNNRSASASNEREKCKMRIHWQTASIKYINQVHQSSTDNTVRPFLLGFHVGMLSPTCKSLANRELDPIIKHLRA